MLNSYYFAAIFACFITSTSAVGNACTSLPYSSLSCLKGNKAASSACSARLPTTAVANEAVATVTVTRMHTSTVLITTSSFAYSISTSTIMATSTKTTYVAANSPAARRLRGRATACTASNALKSLSAMSGASFATACSCIGATTAAIKVAGTTSTTTVNAGLTITSFVNVGATSFAQTVTSTSTTTLRLAAPTFSHVYAATGGCQDTPTVDTLELDPGVTDKDTAVSMCQSSCAQNGKCASLFVQNLFPSYGDATPFYKCFMNGKFFDQRLNLLCGLSGNIWGAADAFDAVGRGV